MTMWDLCVFHLKLHFLLFYNEKLEPKTNSSKKLLPGWVSVRRKCLMNLVLNLFLFQCHFHISVISVEALFWLL